MAELHLTDDTFKKEVLESSIPVVVDFWAPWCMPCQIVGPIIEELAKEYEGKVKVCKMEVDKNRATAAQYKIMSIPAILFFKNGEVVDQQIGVIPKETFKEKLDKLLQ